MIRAILLLTILATCSSVQSAPITGFLTVSNGQIVDEENNIVRLRGFNMAGWLTHENWLNPGFALYSGDDFELSIREGLNVYNPDQDIGKTFTDEFKKHFIGRGDLEYWSSLGFNVVRLNVSHLLLEQGEIGFDLMDQVIDWAAELDTYVIINLMTVPGCANPNYYCSVSQQADFWGSYENLDATVDLWKSIAQRYMDRHNVAGYNLMNEPNAPSHEALQFVYRRLIEEVRSVDQNHIIFLDGNSYAANFGVFADGSLAAMDSNLVYNFHLYSASTCDPSVDWRERIINFIGDPIFKQIRGQQVPVQLSEYAGLCSEWIDLVHTIMQEAGVQHLSYYSPKCAKGTYDNSKCLSKMSSYDNWVELLLRARLNQLLPDWESGLGLEELGSSNFIYDQDRMSILERDYR